jgi:hypothetical protein
LEWLFQEADFGQALQRFRPKGRFEFDKVGKAFAEDRFPFAEDYRLIASSDRSKKFFRDMYYSTKNDWRKIDYKWLSMAEDLAIKMNNHTNNSSLVLAIELSKNGKVLLFPGDAQVGSWLGWSDLTWTVDGETVTSDDLLARTVFYKVGHHGSHNATLRNKGLEKMNSPELTAMIPVDETFAKEDQNWKHIPSEPLLDRLKEKCRNRVIRSDQPLPGVNDRPSNTSAAGWKRFLDRLEKENDLYVDLTINV